MCTTLVTSTVLAIEQYIKNQGKIAKNIKTIKILRVFASLEILVQKIFVLWFLNKRPVSSMEMDVNTGLDGKCCCRKTNVGLC